ncbi:MAG: hypothetical protein IKD69_09875 [Solobacterium sp.]|nr:hypothetical protein [Solobacterium sp.]
MLEEVEFQKQEIVNERHVTDLVNGKDQHKSQKELPESESASEAIPDGDHACSQDHQNTDDKKRPSDGPGPVEELLFSLHQHCFRFFGGRGEKPVILNKRNG